MKSSGKPIPVTELRALAARDAVAQEILATLAGSLRAEKTQDLYRFYAKLNRTTVPNVKELLRVYERFQALGLGRLFISRQRGVNHKFDWTANQREVGILSRPDSHSDTRATTKPEEGGIRFVAVLRDGSRVSLSLRSQAEVKQLIDELTELL